MLSRRIRSIPCKRITTNWKLYAICWLFFGHDRICSGFEALVSGLTCLQRGTFFTFFLTERMVHSLVSQGSGWIPSAFLLGLFEFVAENPFIPFQTFANRVFNQTEQCVGFFWFQQEEEEEMKSTTTPPPPHSALYVDSIVSGCTSKHTVRG